MSLLTQASPFNTVEGKPEKMKSNMMDAFKRIQSEQQNNNNNNNNNHEVDPQSIQYLRSSKVEQQQTTMEVKPQPTNDGDRLTDFVIPPPPRNTDVNANANANIRNTPVSYSNKNNGSSFSQSYGSTPYYKGITQQSQQGGGGGGGGDFNHSNKQLMEKLNYMIHLLEEQQKEPTQNIMEEFALYGLLGVFMIYIVDSFARVGKYTR
jgi:hypothetical protein